MAKTTAVATLYTKQSSAEGQTLLSFNADYNDRRNREWAKYTPGLVLNMHVLDSIADQFEQGKTYILTLEEDVRPESEEEAPAAQTEPNAVGEQPADSEPVTEVTPEAPTSEPTQEDAPADPDVATDPDAQDNPDTNESNS